MFIELCPKKLSARNGDAVASGKEIIKTYTINISLLTERRIGTNAEGED